MDIEIKKRFDAISRPEAIKLFFGLLKELLEYANISNDDERLALNIRKNELKRFSVNINSRLVLMIDDNHFAIMINDDNLEELSHISFIKNETFEKQTKATLCYLTYELLLQNLELLKEFWLKSCIEYFPLQEKSQYRSHHNDELYRIAKDNEFLENYLYKMKESDMSFKEIVNDFKDYIKNQDSIIKGWTS